MTDLRAHEDGAAARDEAWRRPTAHEHLMTDLPNSAADAAANASTPDGETPAGDPELAALVARTDAAIRNAPAPGEPPTPPRRTRRRPPSPASMPCRSRPLAAAVTDGPPPARPRRRRSLALRFGVSFVLGFLLAVGIGAGALYAWSQQYEGRVLPGVRVGSTELGGLTREQAQAELASAYGSLGNGQITLTGPDGQKTTISYADVGRGPDASALVDAALAAGRQGEPLANLIGAPQAAIHGVTLDSAVAYDRDKLAAAVDALATTIDQTPVDASVSAGEDGTFSFTPAKDGRAVDKAALLTALDQQLAALDTPASIAMAVPVVPLAPTVATATAEAAKAAADRMAADVVVARGKDNWTIAGTSLAPLISFSTAADGSITPVFDEAGLDPMLKTLAPKVKQTVRDAGLKMVGGHVVATGNSREGRTLKVPRPRPRSSARSAPVRPAQRPARRGRRQGRRPEADHGGRQGVRPEHEGHQLVQRLLLGHRQQPLWREHRGSGHGDQRHGRAGRHQVRLLEGRRRPARCTRHRAGQRDRGREDHRHRRVRRRHLHHLHDAVQRGVPGRHGAGSPDRTTTSSSTAIRRASMPRCGSSATPSRP